MNDVQDVLYVPTALQVAVCATGAVMMQRIIRFSHMTV